MANREHNLLYVCFYLHHIEKILNGRIYRFFHREGLYAYDPVRLLDYKMNCVAAIVECCPGYDPDKGADFLTYAYYDIGNAILNCRRYEESGSFKNLDEYKTVRGIAWLYNKARDSRKKTIAAFMEKTGCTKKTAEDYLTAARKNRGNVSIYETILRERDKEFSEDFDEYITEGDGEDLSRDAGGVYATMLWDSSWAGAVQRAHGKLDYRSQILIERHMAVCSTVCMGAELALPLLCFEPVVSDINLDSASPLIVFSQFVSNVLTECKHKRPHFSRVFQVSFGCQTVPHGLHRGFVVILHHAGVVQPLCKANTGNPTFPELSSDQVFRRIGKGTYGTDSIIGKYSFGSPSHT